MKIKFILISAIILLSAVIVFIACESKPTKPEYNNIFDPGNPSTSGDPFQLQLSIGNGGITLTWTKPDVNNLTNFKIYRSEQENTGYTSLNTISANKIEYIDQTIENGHSYWYKVTAIDDLGKESASTNISAINIKTEPILVINNGDEYTASKEVVLTILANTAQEMMISNSNDFSGSNWESYSTTKNWTLLNGEGEKTVYLKVKYTNNNESIVVADKLIPQPMNPSINTLGNSGHTSTRNINIILSALGSNLQMKLSEDSTFTGINWQSFVSPLSFELSINEGKKSIFAKFQNDFEIESIIVKRDIILDMTPPIPVLIASPDSGITNETTFQFDPTGSYDQFFPFDTLQARYDWENDGTWDTNWDLVSIIEYQYSIGGGGKTIKMEIKDRLDWSADTLIQIFVNTIPVAIFTAIQDVTNDSLFHFDASNSFDYEDGTQLQYRWDFDGNGSWETSWSAQDTISYTFSDFGNYASILSVRDLNNLTSDMSNQVVVNPICKDIDGNKYKVVKIGDQWWMAENLRVIHYQNGDPIQHVMVDSVWTNISNGAYCNYDNNANNINTYGRLYNWYSVIDNRDISPQGWHIPSDDEWKQLEMYLGMSQSQTNLLGWRGSDEGGKLKEQGTGNWNSPNSGATNSSGFTALPGGYRLYHNGSFGGLGSNGFWWTITESGSVALNRLLTSTNSDINRSNGYKRYGFSIRCVWN